MTFTHSHAASTRYSFLTMSVMIDVVAEQQYNVELKLCAIRQAKSSISIADMFDMQMRMNKLSQFSEMCTSVIGAANNSINSLARGIKQ